MRGIAFSNNDPSTRAPNHSKSTQILTATCTTEAGQMRDRSLFTTIACAIDHATIIYNITSLTMQPANNGPAMAQGTSA